MYERYETGAYFPPIKLCVSGASHDIDTSFGLKALE